MSDIDNVLKSLQLMHDGEVAVSEFYAACMQRWTDNADFWKALSEEELGHSRDIKTMYGMISAAPQRFKPNKPFTQEALRVFLAGVLKLQKRVRENDMDENEALVSAREIERSLIERRFDRVVITEDPEYLKLLDNINHNEESHLMLITGRIGR